MYLKTILMIIVRVFTENTKGLWSSHTLVSKYKWTADKGACTSDQTTANTSEGISVVAYSTESVILWCNVCDVGDDGDIKWLYAKDWNKAAATLRYNKHMVLYSNGNLQIYDVRSEDQGVYVCSVGDLKGKRNILEVLEERDHPLVGVRPKEAKKGKKPAEAITVGNVSIYTKWSPWSLCSTCQEGDVGIRYCIGTCYLKELNTDIVASQMVFKEGIWCHSSLLPSQYKDMDEIKNRSNEIMTGLCTMKCMTDGKIQTSDGREIDAHPNMINKHGMLNDMPASFHLPTMKVIHVNEGERLTIECDGHLLSDATKRWTRDDDEGNAIRQETYMGKKKKRVRVTDRQKLVIEKAKVKDSGSYSCWKLDELVIHVKLKVYDGHILEIYAESVLSFILCAVVMVIMLYCNFKVFRLYRRLVKDDRLR